MSSNAPYVLHVLSRLERGGAEMRTLEVLRAIGADRFRFGVVATSGLAGTLDETFRAAGVEVYPLRLGIGFPAGFHRLLRRTGAAIVHSHLHLTSGPILALARAAGVPRRVAHFRSSGDGRGNGIARRASRRLRRTLIDRYATDVLGVSASALEAVWGGGWRTDARFRVVYSGVAQPPALAPDQAAGLRAELDLPPTGPVLIHVGRVHPSKNHLRLVQIFAQLHQRDPRARLLLVGREDPVLSPPLRAEIARLGVTGQVHPLGERSDVARLLAAADLLLFPSVWEGMPGAVVEAAAVGTPVLGSAIPPVLEAGRLLPGVRTLDLAATDDQWVDAAFEMMGAPLPRAVARAGFAASPFAMAHARERLLAVWEGRACAE